MRRRFFYIFILAISLISTQTLLGQVRLPRLVSDGVVLQRDIPVNIWGWASPGEKVKLRFNSLTFETITSTDGNWKIILPEQKAGGPFEMEITASNAIKLKNILFGDVWLCSGQSNMELPMSRVAPIYGKEIENCTNPKYPIVSGFRCVGITTTFRKIFQGGKWEEANPQNILKYTAVGYFFAHDLYEKYKVPVGIIQCAAGRFKRRKLDQRRNAKSLSGTI